MDATWPAALAVAGTLLGALTTGITQYATATRTRRTERAEQQHQTACDALSTLLQALAEHRSQQYLKIAARRDGTADTTEARTARYTARNTATAAYTAVTMTIRDSRVLDAARELRNASYALGDAPDNTVQEAGDRARAAHDTLLAEAARYAHTRH